MSKELRDVRRVCRFAKMVLKTIQHEGSTDAQKLDELEALAYELGCGLEIGWSLDNDG